MRKCVPRGEDLMHFCKDLSRNGRDKVASGESRIRSSNYAILTRRTIECLAVRLGCSIVKTPAMTMLYSWLVSVHFLWE